MLGFEWEIHGDFTGLFNGFFNGGLLIVILMVFLRDCHGYFLGHYGIYWDSGSKVGGAVKLYTSVYRYTLLITKK